MDVIEASEGLLSWEPPKEEEVEFRRWSKVESACKDVTECFLSGLARDTPSSLGAGLRLMRKVETELFADALLVRLSPLATMGGESWKCPCADEGLAGS